MAFIIWNKGYEPDFVPRDDRPFVLISCAISLDGKLSSESGDTRLSSREDKVLVHKLRSEVDGILVGINTVLSDDPHLTVSEKYYKSERHPVRVILDNKARIPLESQVLTRKPEVPTIIAVSEKADKKKVEKLVRAGAKVIYVGKNEVNLSKLLKILRDKFKINTLMVEGGGKVIASFFKEKLVDYLRLSVNPVIFGGDNSIPMFRGHSYKTIEESPKLELIKIEKAGWSVILHYLVKF